MFFARFAKQKKVPMLFSFISAVVHILLCMRNSTKKKENEVISAKK
jgi:hypothetical protein